MEEEKVAIKNSCIHKYSIANADHLDFREKDFLI